MHKKKEDQYDKTILESLRPPEINQLLQDAETSGRIEITLETELEERLSND